MVWRIDDPQGNEAGKVKYDIVKYTRGIVLDLGCGPTKTFPHFLGVDSCKDTELFNIPIKPDVNCDVSDPKAMADTFNSLSVDAIFSSHCLEHIEDYRAALRAWWDVLKVGGYLILYLPHKDLYPRIGEYGSNPDHKHDFDGGEIESVMMDIGDCDMVEWETRDAGTEYSFLQIFQKLPPGSGWKASMYDEPLFGKTACVVRYGGFGDMLQAANILPQLKREGYRVTVMTTPKGQDILREDPHIDAWFIQDDNQVPNHELTAFWEVQAKHFDKFINLSESVEGTLLALPGRANHSWPDAVRRVELNKNYLEWTSALAELEYHNDARFYPDSKEKTRVAGYLAGLKASLTENLPVGAVPPNRFMILWALSGSSCHKFYPWQDSVIARIMMEMPDAVVIFSGDEACKILELGWENETRVRCESGNIDIRSTLTLAQQVDCVVGPETGVLNAVAFEQVPKVLLLSHSTVENLPKHWRNCAPIEPMDTPCYPCHRLHYGYKFCNEHQETGAAMCQINITPDRVYDAIHEAYLHWKANETPRIDLSLAR